MAYILFLLTNAALFVRPSELFPSLGNVQLYMLLIAATIACSLQRLHNQFTLRTMLQQPVNLCVAGMVAAVVLSHVTRGASGAAATGAVMMAKVAVYYMLLVALVNTPERLRRFLLCTGICSTLMIALSVNDYFHFVAEWQGRPDLREVFEKERWLPEGEPRQLRHYPDSQGFDGDGNEIWLFRVCGLGIFHDPNDFSLLITVTSIIAVYFLLDKRLGPARWLWLASLAILGTAYFYTFSRGGLLALGFAGMVWLATRYGGKVAIGMGLLGASAVPVALSRQASMSLSSGTGHDRIQAWSDGLVLLKSPRLFFGIGEGEYANAVGLVAHNSYVHSFVELGIFGGALFFGCFYFPAYAMYRLKRTEMPIPHPELARMFPYIAAILAGWCMGMASLSRCYVAPTYMVAGVAAAYLNLVGYHRPQPAPLQTFNWHTAQRWAICSAGLLACCFLFIKVFARYS
jgi:hypothetical protein